MYLLIGLIMLVSVLLVLVILPQNSKGGGLAGGISTGANQLIGVKKTADLFEKLTWGGIGVIFVLTLATTFMEKPTAATLKPIENPPTQQQPVTPQQPEQKNPLPAEPQDQKPAITIDTTKK